MGPGGLYWERLTQCPAIPSWLEGSIAECPTARVLAGGSCPRLAPLCFPQMHIVHMNVKYQTLAEAKGHPNGLAVLGFFFQVGLQGPPRTWVLVVQPGEHCTGVLREREGAGGLGQGQERLGTLPHCSATM